MIKLPFPLSGRLGVNHILRTVHRDGEVNLRYNSDTQIDHLARVALRDWRPDCRQLIHDLSGSGYIVPKSTSFIPTMKIGEESNGEQFFQLIDIETDNYMDLEYDSGRQLMFELLESPFTIILTSDQSFNHYKNELTERKKRQNV